MFASNRDGSRDLYRMNADGSNVLRLTNHPAADGYPSWSPEGHRIVFRSDRDGSVGLYALVLP